MATLQYFQDFFEPFNSGSATSSSVPGFYPVALGGRPYLVDVNQIKFSTVPIRREQADTSQVIGEYSLNREDLWRRTTDDWSHGAGQEYYDRASGDTSRFNASKGVDPWTKWQLTLLNDTAKKRNSTNTNLFMVVAGARWYLTDGNQVRFTTTISSSDDTTNVTGYPATNPNSITSDGFTVWTSHGADRVYSTNTGITTASAYVTSGDGADIVAYVKGRLMAAGTGANKHKVYNITASGAMPAALFTHNNTDFIWVGFTEASSFIYMAGFSGDKSLVYRTSIRPDGTALDIPVVAGELPDGEIIRALQGYLGFMVLGTDKGVRFATIDGNGNLTIGRLINIGQAVRCFEPQDRFVWFGWTNFDGTSTGLGRLDLSVFTDPLTPGYSSDLMATAQGNTLSIITFSDKRVFSVSASGFWVQDTNLVASGTIDSGKITYGMADPKVGMFIDLKHGALVAGGIIETQVSVDDASLVSAGTSQVDGDKEASYPVGQRLNSAMELRHILTRDTAATTGPILLSHTLRSQPAPKRTRVFLLPLILHERIMVEGVERTMEPLDELNALQGMIDGKLPVSFQDGVASRTVFVEDLEFTPDRRTTDYRWWNGTCLVKLKEVVS